MRWFYGVLAGIGLSTLLALTAWAQDGGRRRPPQDAPLPPAVAAQTDLSVLLGRPTAHGITVSVLSAVAREGYVEYGAGAMTQHTATVAFPALTPTEVPLTGLQPDTAYVYRLCARYTGAAAFTPGTEHTFHTQRAPGSTFSFAIQGDSHPERPQMHDPALYAQTLQAAAAGTPDFYLTIGDDFSVDAMRTEANADSVRAIYLHQRYCLSLIGQSAPVFLTNGNHEQASQYNLDGTADNIAVWAQTARNTLFPEPAPDGFYTGDAQPVDHIGLLRDYYAWTWGDALFVVIDPYWHSKALVDNLFGSRDKGGKGGGQGRDLWQVSLGDAQYRWLKGTLEGSRAKYKFVFAHHVLGTMRGGTDVADLYEWGGADRNGARLFADKRPGWTEPIHTLFVKNGVTIFFQGHDHIFVRQQQDGVIYQTLPLPADPYYTLYNADAYHTGDKLPGSGYVRVTVAPDKATVRYIREYLPRDETAEHKSGETAFSYAVAAKTP